ncbi:hypothetical protein PGT21_024477 [Puccinia graminis f. sp. tritici]|uniref:Uncharacterized protein n=1 Tax=Puccinia graminis f. sp. tritici TaxID=56615 RepID=A0A5B0LQP5_PUCGR|nr:hypothetical protein PGTUg99_023435 [Puccinia graminis f. sp. tritici]KAA1071974.1 hypothetical protein PGT21_024477 [Puccinia graminis f. sp. tritici]
MNCLVSVACFLAVLHSTLATPTLAPRADQAAAVHKGQSDEKCFVGCYTYGLNNNLWGVGNSFLSTIPSLYGYPSYGGLFLNTNIGYGTGLGAGLGIFKKDASQPAKHLENSA